MFATDAILATLMCCTRSVNSWDIIVQRVGNKLFFDKRDNSDFGEWGLWAGLHRWFLWLRLHAWRSLLRSQIC